MARLAKPLATWSDDDDDEFPDLDALVTKKKLQAKETASTTQPKPRFSTKTQESSKSATAVRRRKLGPLTDNLLLRAWTPDSAEDDRDEEDPRPKGDAKPRRTRVELRTRNTKPATIIPSSPADQEEEYVSAQEEVTIIEDVSLFDDTFHSCDSDGSVFGDSHEDGVDSDDDFTLDSLPRRPSAKPKLRMEDRKRPGCAQRASVESKGSGLEDEGGSEPRWAPAPEPPRRQNPRAKPSTDQTGIGKAKQRNKDLADTLSKLQLDDETDEQPPRTKTSRSSDREVTPPSTPPKSRPGLVSPKKLSRIPMTPHRPNSDMFWSQEFVDDWNDEHSPRKQLFPDAMAARQRSPTKTSPEKKPTKTAAATKAAEREAKKAFEAEKHALAFSFLRELDTVITDGKLADLAASTGGIKLIWTNKLNTTAGRANWKREAIRTRQADGTTTATKHKHHASIELAEKVINDRHRLLNVLAHEFCHLANFMVSGVTTNPHGREFKAWAAKCSQAFGDRGIEVTTKHSYDIDFKYVWACDECGAEFKRHSKSIDPARHRCGSCRGVLRQVKPVPRGGKKGGGDGEGGGEGGKGSRKGKGVVSEYQVFMKEQMRVVKAENPKSPQKEIMRIVAGRWAEKKARSASSTPTPTEGVNGVVQGLEDLEV